MFRSGYARSSFVIAAGDAPYQPLYASYLQSLAPDVEAHDCHHGPRRRKGPLGRVICTWRVPVPGFLVLGSLGSEDHHTRGKLRRKIRDGARRGMDPAAGLQGQEAVDRRSPEPHAPDGSSCWMSLISRGLQSVLARKFPAKHASGGQKSAPSR